MNSRDNLLKKMASLDNQLMEALGLTTIGLTIDNNTKKYKPLIDHQYNPKYNINENNTLISSVNIDTHKNVSDMCNNINFDQDKKPTSQDEFKFPDGFPASKKIYVIGRIQTISDAEIKKYKNLVYLNLPENNDLVPWSIEINDLFLLCGYNNSFSKTSGNKYKCKPKFSIMLIVDPNNNATINQTQIDLDSFRNDDKDNLVYIHPPKNSGDVKYNYRTCNDKKCFDHSPSVTFTEISLLTKYFNMNCYFLEGYKHIIKDKNNDKNNDKNYDLYFFCLDNCIHNTTIQEFNTKHNNNIQLIQVPVKKTPVQAQAHVPDKKTHVQAQEKYLKYKKKYLELKKYSIQFL
jgi:hypothetical protein